MSLEYDRELVPDSSISFMSAIENSGFSCMLHAAPPRPLRFKRADSNHSEARRVRGTLWVGLTQ